MDLNDQEIQAVLKLEPFKRYQYFIKRIADQENLFTLVNQNGDYALSEIDGKILMVFWSSQEFAEKCRIGEWHDYLIREISLDFFENEIVDQIVMNNYLINVFPANEKSGFIVDINEFTEDLNEELEKYS